MRKLKTADRTLRVAAYIRGIEHGNWEFVDAQGSGDMQAVARVYDRRNPSGVLITAGELGRARALLAFINKIDGQ